MPVFAIFALQMTQRELRHFREGSTLEVRATP